MQSVRRERAGSSRQKWQLRNPRSEFGSKDRQVGEDYEIDLERAWSR